MLSFPVLQIVDHDGPIIDGPSSKDLSDLKYQAIHNVRTSVSTVKTVPVLS